MTNIAKCDFECVIWNKEILECDWKLIS